MYLCSAQPDVEYQTKKALKSLLLREDFSLNLNNCTQIKVLDVTEVKFLQLLDCCRTNTIVLQTQTLEVRPVVMNQAFNSFCSKSFTVNVDFSFEFAGPVEQVPKKHPCQNDASSIVNFFIAESLYANYIVLIIYLLDYGTAVHPRMCLHLIVD